MEVLHLGSFSVHHTKRLFLLKELARLFLHRLSFLVSEIMEALQQTLESLAPAIFSLEFSISIRNRNVKRAPVMSMFIKDLLLFSAYNQEYSVGVSIVQGFVFNKMELEGVVMLVFIIVSVLLLIIPSIMISRQPQSSAALSFSVSYKNDYGL